MRDNRNTIAEQQARVDALAIADKQAAIERKNRVIDAISERIEELKAERDAWKASALALGGGMLKSVKDGE